MPCSSGAPSPRIEILKINLPEKSDLHKEIIFLTLFVRSRAKTSLKDDSPVEEEDDEEEEAKEEGE